MEFLAPIISILWKYIQSRDNCAINVSKMDDELVVRFIEDNHIKTFKTSDIDLFSSNLKHYLPSI